VTAVPARNNPESFPMRNVFVLAALITASLASFGTAAAQSRPGCAWGPQILSRVLAGQQDRRSFTVCPGAAVSICVTTPKGAEVSVAIDGRGAERGKREVCAAMRLDRCRQVPIVLTQKTKAGAAPYKMSCDNWKE
jgi:hypothetical protein